MSAGQQPRQLAFALSHAESLTRDDFLEGPANAAGLALIDAWPDWPNRVMMLVGPEGSGKSHLAAIWADEAGARSIAAHGVTLPLGSLALQDASQKSLKKAERIVKTALAPLTELKAGTGRTFYAVGGTCYCAAPRTCARSHCSR